MKTTTSSPKPTSRPMTVLSFHARVVPPHWIATQFISHMTFTIMLQRRTRRPPDVQLTKKKANDRGQNREGSWQIHLPNLFFQRRFHWLGSGRRVKGKDNDSGRDTADRQIDIECPTPCCVRSEDTSKKWPNHRRDAIDCSQNPGEHCALLRRGAKGDDDVHSRGDAGGAKARDGPPYDQSDRVLGDTANERADFENENGQQV